MIESISELNHKAVRDLAWCIGSTCFLKDPNIPLAGDEKCEMELRRHWDWILQLDNEPDELITWLSTLNSRYLGKHFEGLLEFWLTHSPYYTLIFSNQQIVEKGVTVSEVDFMVKDHDTGFYVHIEVALKYYLFTGNQEQGWLGPNANDHLQAKLDKVSNLQIPILNSRAGKALLEAHGVETYTSLFWLKGDLFSRKEQVVSKNTRVSGSWLRRKELSGLEGRQHWWVELPKSYWVGRACLAPNELSVVRWPELLKEVEQRTDQRTIMVARLQKRDGRFYEEDRYMIVSDNWPELDRH